MSEFLKKIAPVVEHYLKEFSYKALIPLLFLLLVIYVIEGNFPAVPTADHSAWDISAHNDALVKKTEAYIRETLKDPDSAQFKSVRVTSTGPVCGFVNAKNSFGGYVGFRPFYAFVTPDTVYGLYVLGTADEYGNVRPSEDFIKSWKETCWPDQKG